MLLGLRLPRVAQRVSQSGRFAAPPLMVRIPNLIAYISSIMSLEAGDVILTGTPSGVGRLQDGDEVRVEIEGIGSLNNSVRIEKRRSNRS